MEKRKEGRKEELMEGKRKQIRNKIISKKEEKSNVMKRKKKKGRKKERKKKRIWKNKQ
jgi:hypothetical protein